MLDSVPGPSSDGSVTARSRRPLLLSIADLLALPDPEWLIEGILPQGGVAVLYGPPGSGKSFVALDWGMSVDLGSRWSGRQVRQGTAIYICAEGTSGLKQRVGAWLAAVSPEAKGLLIHPMPLDVGNANDRQALVAALRDRDAAPRFIVIDTLNRCFGGLDENSTADMTQFIRGLDDLRSQFPGTAILVVHHSGKDKARGERGSTVLRAAADTVIRLDKQGRTLTLTCEKQKDGEEFDALRLTLETVGLDGRSSCVLRLATGHEAAEGRSGQAAHRATETDRVMLDALVRLGGQAGYAKWLGASGLPKSTFKDAMKRLAPGLVTKDGDRYTLSEEGWKAGTGPEEGRPALATEGREVGPEHPL